MGLDDGSEIVFAMTNVYMLIEGSIREKAEANFVTRSHHDPVIVRDGRSTHHVGALNRGTSRTSTDGASTVEQVEKLFEG